MTKPIISVENLSKAYRLGLKEEVPETLVSAVTGAIKAPFKNWKRLSSLDTKAGGDSEDILWALKDVSFDVHEGEVVGIIGRNGAGKSTLLKVLSRITEPTSGCVKLRGRVSSLLEVGTGFHPELTGRDNIYMNGTILGMSKREIDKKFDEIVDFSGVEKFLDTPVKRYSSGMLVRLAFSVAAHLEPEILIVDEVLAVGDAEFQKKCLGKMQDVSQSGRTVLFVSHNMPAVRELCPICVYLENGTIKGMGDTTNVLDQYLEYMSPGLSIEEREDRSGLGNARLKSITIFGVNRNLPPVTGEDLSIEFELSGNLMELSLACSFTIYDQHGRPVSNIPHSRGQFSSSTAVCCIKEVPLREGLYYLNVRVSSLNGVEDLVERAVTFHVQPGTYRGKAMRGNPQYGAVCFEYNWDDN